MQNIDYSKKISLDQRKHITPREPKARSASPLDNNKSERFSSQSFMNMIQSEGSSLSFIYLFVGAVLFFTSGLVVGMKIDQNENYFAKNEVSSFSNPGEKPYEEAEENTETTPSPTVAREALRSPTRAPKGLKYPPLENHTNYIIRVGKFSLQDANRWARYLIKDEQGFQGRLFRTSSGTTRKLYLGFYYDKSSVRKALKYVRKMNGGIFRNASVKKMRF
ncbi:MAG: hypothetical protein AAF518_13590 [Spirochaetota bacterium]